MMGIRLRFKNGEYLPFKYGYLPNDDLDYVQFVYNYFNRNYSKLPRSLRNLKFIQDYFTKDLNIEFEPEISTIEKYLLDPDNGVILLALSFYNPVKIYFYYLELLKNGWDYEIEYNFR